ncbi:peptidoglycan-binding protein [Bombella mellum]|uniref:Peptidoglycan binding-like domain-containing protein n=1 Tax=Bombella mellum TaxID=2039288 RepID=A0ABR5ZU12_9PROT|nr:peptidoglycan-binding protein [Bombella mellum]MBA5727819.1 hypothetical protein [Bombella mellum]
MSTGRTQHQGSQLMFPQDLTKEQRARADLVMIKFVEELKKEGADLSVLSKDTLEGSRLRGMLSNYMGQADVETWHFKKMEENLKYKYNTLESKDEFLRECINHDRKHHNSRTFIDLDHHRRRIENLSDVDDFNKISPDAKGDFRYDHRMGNKEGEGHLYKGRGYCQLTGHDNYKTIGQKLGIDLLKYPELASNPRIATEIAIEYLKENQHGKLLTDAAIDSERLTRTINGGRNALDQRVTRAQEWDVAIKNGYTPRPVSEEVVPPTVFSRSSKEDITRLQEKLNIAGYDVAVDGLYDARTKAAVTKLQEVNGLTPHGVADSDTLSRLDVLCRARQTQTASTTAEVAQSVRAAEHSAHPAENEVRRAEASPAFQTQASPHVNAPSHSEASPHLRGEPLRHEAAHEMSHEVGREPSRMTVPLLREGSHGDRVSDVQHELNALHYTGRDGRELSVDGKFGPLTKYGVEEFQRDNGLKVDGLVGSQTRQVLDDAYRARQAQTVESILLPEKTARTSEMSSVSDAGMYWQNLLHKVQASPSADVQQRQTSTQGQTQEFEQTQSCGWSMRM